MKALVELLNTNQISEDEDVADQNKHQDIFSDRLRGQTIKSAHIKHTTNGGEIKLEFVSTTSPSTITWNNSGKVVFSFKGTKYIIKK